VERQAEREPLADHLGFGERAIGREDPAVPADAGGEGPFHLSEEGGPAVGKGIVAERRKRNPMDVGLLAEQDRLGQEDDIAAGQIDLAVVRPAPGDAACEATPNTPMMLVDVLHGQVEDDQRSDRPARDRREKAAEPIQFGRFPAQAVPDVDGEDALPAGKVGDEDATVQAAADQNSDIWILLHSTAYGNAVGAWGHLPAGRQVGGSHRTGPHIQTTDIVGECGGDCQAARV